MADASLDIEAAPMVFAYLNARIMQQRDP